MAILVWKLLDNGKYAPEYPSVEVVTQKKILDAELQDRKIKEKICSIEDNARKKSLLKLKGKKKDVVKLYHYVGSQLKPFIESLNLNLDDKKYIWGAINYHAKELKLDGKIRLDRDRGHGNTWRYCIRLAEYSEEDAFELDWTQWVELFDTTLAQNDSRIIDWIISTKREYYKGKEIDGGLQDWFRILRKSITNHISKKVKLDTTYLTEGELYAELNAALKAAMPEFESRKKEVAEKETKNKSLTQRLQTAEQEVQKKSNILAKMQQDYTEVRTEYEAFKAEAKSAAAAAAAEIAQRDQKIAGLESKNSDMTAEMTGLKKNITNLEDQILNTERKLAASEEDREFLSKELDRLKAEKAELERQFQDLLVLRKQVRQLLDELTAERKLQWLRRGLYRSARGKGGAMLKRLESKKEHEEKPTPGYDLEVEINKDGSINLTPATEEEMKSNDTPESGE